MDQLFLKSLEELEMEFRELERQMMEDPRYKRIEELKEKISLLDIELAKLDELHSN